MVGGLAVVPPIKDTSSIVSTPVKSKTVAEPLRETVKRSVRKTDAQLRDEAIARADALSKSMTFQQKVRAVYDRKLSIESLPSRERNAVANATGKLYWQLKREASRKKNLKAAQERYNKDAAQVARLRAKGQDTSALEQRMRKYSAQINKFQGGTQAEFRQEMAGIKKRAQTRANLPEARRKRFVQTTEAFKRSPGASKSLREGTRVGEVKEPIRLAPMPVGSVTKVDLSELGLVAKKPIREVPSGVLTPSKVGPRQPLINIALEPTFTVPVSREKKTGRELQEANAAQAISEFNAKVDVYNKKPSIFRDGVEKKRLDIEREKVVTVISRALPGVQLSKQISVPGVTNRETSYSVILQQVKDEVTEKELKAKKSEKRLEAFEERVENLIDWEKRAGERAKRVEDIFKQIPGLGLEVPEEEKRTFRSWLTPEKWSTVGRTALSIPGQIVVGLPERVALAAAKTVAAIEGLTIEQARGAVGKELWRATKETPGVVARAYDPRTAEGLINIIATAAMIKYIGGKGVQAKAYVPKVSKTTGKPAITRTGGGSYPKGGKIYTVEEGIFTNKLGQQIKFTSEVAVPAKGGVGTYKVFYKNAQTGQLLKAQTGTVNYKIDVQQINPNVFNYDSKFTIKPKLEGKVSLNKKTGDMEIIYKSKTGLARTYKDRVRVNNLEKGPQPKLIVKSSVPDYVGRLGTDYLTRFGTGRGEAVLRDIKYKNIGGGQPRLIPKQGTVVWEKANIRTQGGRTWVKQQGTFTNLQDNPVSFSIRANLPKVGGKGIYRITYKSPKTGVTQGSKTGTAIISSEMLPSYFTIRYPPGGGEAFQISKFVRTEPGRFGFRRTVAGKRVETKQVIGPERVLIKKTMQASGRPTPAARAELARIRRVELLEKIRLKAQPVTKPTTAVARTVGREATTTFRKLLASKKSQVAIQPVGGFRGTLSDLAGTRGGTLAGTRGETLVGTRGGIISPPAPTIAPGGFFGGVPVTAAPPIFTPFGFPTPGLIVLPPSIGLQEGRAGVIEPIKEGVVTGAIEEVITGPGEKAIDEVISKPDTPIEPLIEVPPGAITVPREAIIIRTTTGGGDKPRPPIEPTQTIEVPPPSPEIPLRGLVGFPLLWPFGRRRGVPSSRFRRGVRTWVVTNPIRDLPGEFFSRRTTQRIANALGKPNLGTDILLGSKVSRVMSGRTNNVNVLGGVGINENKIKKML